MVSETCNNKLVSLGGSSQDRCVFQWTVLDPVKIDFAAVPPPKRTLRNYPFIR